MLSAKPLRFFLLLVLTLVIVGCSFTRLGYQNIEWLISWKSGDYVTLNREQKRWLRQEVRELHAWHCNEELPRYPALLSALQDDMLAPSPDPGKLQTHLTGLQQEAARTLGKLAPTLATLLASLSDRQVAELTANLAKQQREFKEKYTEPAIAKQNAERSERMQERLESWLGRLDPAQITRIDSWAKELEGQNQVWLDNRDNWQGALRALLENRQAKEFATRFETLLMQPESAWTEPYRLQRPRSEAAAAQMLSDVMRKASAAQRQHLQSRADGYLTDIQRVRCSPTNG